MKSGPVAFLLWIVGITGICGLHRFYLGRPWTGLLWLFTLGLLGIGQIVDLFLLGSMVRQANLAASVQGTGAAAGNHNIIAPIINVNINRDELIRQ